LCISIFIQSRMSTNNMYNQQNTWHYKKKSLTNEIENWRTTFKNILLNKNTIMNGLPDKDPYHNRGRDQMRKKGGPDFKCLCLIQPAAWWIFTTKSVQALIITYIYHRHSNSGPPFSSFGPSRDYGMNLCLEVYLWTIYPYFTTFCVTTFSFY
jgi:hypothetical protein